MIPNGRIKVVVATEGVGEDRLAESMSGIGIGVWWIGKWITFGLNFTNRTTNEAEKSNRRL